MLLGSTLRRRSLVLQSAVLLNLMLSAIVMPAEAKPTRRVAQAIPKAKPPAPAPPVPAAQKPVPQKPAPAPKAPAAAPAAAPTQPTSPVVPAPAATPAAPAAAQPAAAQPAAAQPAAAQPAGEATNSTAVGAGAGATTSGANANAAPVAGGANAELSAEALAAGDAGSTEPYFNPDEVDVIKVTVDRREKSIQDYAGSVTAFTQQDLERVGVNSVRTLSSATPYVEIGTQEGNTEIFIRGVGSENNTELGDPAAATHVDGVYIPRPRGVGSMFFDLERVEINRGPQGTLRGRNATAGSLNILTAKPKLDAFGAEASLQLGNYSQRMARGMLNIPLTPRLALRFAAFSENHEPFYENAGPVHTLTAAESADALAYRASARWQPLRGLTVDLQHDYTQEKGTGVTGTNFNSALRAGLLPEEVPNPRAVIYRGPQGSQDMTHWGLHGNVVVELGPASIEYLGSYRDLDYRQTVGGNAGVAFPGMPDPEIDNWSASYWHTTSKSVVQELRLFAPDTARFRWTVGGFFFNEEQTSFLGTTADQSTGFAGVEYNMPEVSGRSWAGYADGTFDILEMLRATAGVRVTTERKERRGIGSVYGFSGLGDQPFRYGTEGFRFADGGRSNYTQPAAGPVAPFEEFTNGIASFGARDNLQALLQQPGVSQWDNINEQNGEYSDTFLDFRVGVEHDLTPKHLLYVTFASGHKSGGFNDNVRLMGGGSVAPTYNPESLYATEIGSKNEFLDGKLIANLAAFWYSYQDQQFQSVQEIADTGVDGAVAATAVRFNAASSQIFGAEADATYRLPYGLQAGVAAMLLDARFTEGEVLDTRVGFGLADQDRVDLEGNFLTRAPRLSVNYSLAQNIPTPIGYFDWVVSAQTKTAHYMTVFNGEGRNSQGEVDPNLSDRVPTYTRLDAGIGYTRPDGLARLDAFVSNLTDITYLTTLINTPGLNLRFFNPPRQMGVRLSLFL